MFPTRLWRWLALAAVTTTAMVLGMEDSAAERFRDAAHFIEQAYFVSFFDAARLRFLCL